MNRVECNTIFRNKEGTSTEYNHNIKNNNKLLNRHIKSTWRVSEKEIAS